MQKQGLLVSKETTEPPQRGVQVNITILEKAEVRQPA